MSFHNQRPEIIIMTARIKVPQNMQRKVGKLLHKSDHRTVQDTKHQIIRNDQNPSNTIVGLDDEHPNVRGKIRGARKR